MVEPGSSSLPSSLVLVGAGKMGGAMLEGWLSIGLRPEAITVLEPRPSPELLALGARHEIAVNPPLNEGAKPQVVVLAVKPQALDAAVPAMTRLVGSDTLLISILAGKTVADLACHVPSETAIVRAMPNLAAAVRSGATGAFGSADVTEAQRAMAHALLSGIGIVEWVESERLIDAVTAVSGSGPAYVFYLTECLAEAGTRAGLPEGIAERLARATVIGVGELLKIGDVPPGEFRQNVTSPGGTTAAALGVLMAEPGLRELLRDAVAAAKRRAEELAG